MNIETRPVKRPIVSGIVWLGLGLLLLSITTDILPPLRHSWPALLIVIGLALMIGALVKNRTAVTKKDNDRV